MFIIMTIIQTVFSALSSQLSVPKCNSTISAYNTTASFKQQPKHCQMDLDSRWESLYNLVGLLAGNIKSIFKLRNSGKLNIIQQESLIGLAEVCFKQPHISPDMFNSYVNRGKPLFFFIYNLQPPHLLCHSYPVFSGHYNNIVCLSSRSPFHFFPTSLRKYCPSSPSQYFGVCHPISPYSCTRLGA